jgi:hypothetical protein
MPIAIHETSFESKEPWLIDRPALDDLDRTIDEVWKELECARGDLIQEYIEQKVEKLRVKTAVTGDNIDEEALRESATANVPWKLKLSERKIILRLENGARLEGQKFDEIAIEPTIRGSVVKQIEVTLESGPISVDLKTTKWEDGLELQASPDQDLLAQRAYARLLSWCEENRLPRWVRIWKSSRWLALPVFMFVSWFLLIAISVTHEPPTQAAKRQWKEEAAEILKDGITADEHLRAIELTLAICADYVSDDSKPRATVFTLQRSLFFIAATIVFTVLLAFPPRTAIGLGRGQKRIEWWRRWIHIVAVAGPGTIFMGLVIDPILTLLRGILW